MTLRLHPPTTPALRREVGARPSPIEKADGRLARTPSRAENSPMGMRPGDKDLEQEQRHAARLHDTGHERL